MQYYQEAIAEQYDAQYTTDYENELACALFCLARDDCELSIDRLFDLFKSRLLDYITVPPLEHITDLIEFAAGVSQDSTYVVDLAFFFAWGSAKLGSFFFGKVFDTTFQLLLKLSVNDANNDWSLLCTDCPDDPGVGSWRIFTEYNPALNLGNIEEQTATYIRVASTANGDGLYRIVLRRNLGCTTVSGVSTTPAASYSAQGCDGWIDGPLGNGNYLNQYYGQSPAPFVVEFNTPE